MMSTPIPRYKKGVQRCPYRALTSRMRGWRATDMVATAAITFQHAHVARKSTVARTVPLRMSGDQTATLSAPSESEMKNAAPAVEVVVGALVSPARTDRQAMNHGTAAKIAIQARGRSRSAVPSRSDMPSNAATLALWARASRRTCAGGATLSWAANARRLSIIVPKKAMVAIATIPTIACTRRD